MKILTRIQVSASEYAELKKLAIDRGQSLAELLTEAIVASPVTGSCFVARITTEEDS